MGDAKLKPYLDRVEEARRDYALALAQIVDDATDAGIKPHMIMADFPMLAWAREYNRKNTSGSIYFAKVEDIDVVKVGFSTNVQDRMRALRSEHNKGFMVLGTVAGTMADERWFHQTLSWCRDRSLKGNEFFSYSPIRGLIRIFLSVADRFPFDQARKDETAAWVHRVREAGAKTKPTAAEALIAIGEYFDRQAAEVFQPKGAA
jgi:hypothetical protein